MADQMSALEFFHMLKRSAGQMGLNVNYQEKDGMVTLTRTHTEDKGMTSLGAFTSLEQLQGFLMCWERNRA